MFQCAFGISVGIQRVEETFFSYTPNWRPFGLDAWNVGVKLVSESGPQYVEPGFTYDPQVFNAPRGSTFIGYWQTWKYFNEEVLRRAFTLRSNPSMKTFEMAQRIGESGPHNTFIHVRRTDYTQGHTRDYHGLPSPEYYTAAIEHIRGWHPDAKFFVFSDDPEWCRASFPDFTVVDHNAGTPHEDMFLMSLCRHGIIANSSFSWWGAWLGGNPPERIVIAPKKWFSANLDTRDLIPDGWMRL